MVSLKGETAASALGLASVEPRVGHDGTLALRNDSLNDGALCGGSFGGKISTVGFVPLCRDGSGGVGVWARWPAPFYFDFLSI